ncbi:unnamed protein product [Phaedon cochleariae]|uniref:FAM13A-like domain-containing protein n=1 Tax=Phaedon cochleariae TaxID=80249 RepID=A0A9N9X832_PHACE|nr:unnamed protein product [Phaedon cochleariae]
MVFYLERVRNSAMAFIFVGSNRFLENMWSLRERIKLVARRMKGPTRRDETTPKTYETKANKTKRLTTVKCQTAAITYDEAKAACKARKRKERQESISSLCQERKVIRSNSEERPEQKRYEKSSAIRRVSSSEDFQSKKSGTAEKIIGSPIKAAGDKCLAYEDNEHERRRSHERFARPLTLKGKKYTTKRVKVRPINRTKFKPEPSQDGKDHKKLVVPQGAHSTDQGEVNTSFLQLHRNERARSPSPTLDPVSPILDWSTLHELVHSSEPVLSQTARQINENTETMPGVSVALNRLLSSPRNSIIATHKIYLDPDVPKPMSNLDSEPENPVDERLQKISKQVNSFKKKIKRLESDFEKEYGYKPSHTDKMYDSSLKKLYGELSKLKKDQKQLADISSSCALIDVGGNGEPGSLQMTINEIEKKLSIKRDAADRGSNIEEMSSEQLVEEKVAIQKALLFLESVHGRPIKKEDRDLVRPFYDRYRTLKRLVNKLSTNNSSGELATIHENETMTFTTPPSSSIDTESEKTSVQPPVTTDSDTDSSLGENLHAMSRRELMEQLKLVTEERKNLRRKIKEFELEVQLNRGKMVQKDDRAPMEGVYAAYKKIKAKARLLDALVGKQT